MSFTFFALDISLSEFKIKHMHGLFLLSKVWKIAAVLKFIINKSTIHTNKVCLFNDKERMRLTFQPATRTTGRVKASDLTQVGCSLAGQAGNRLYAICIAVMIGAMCS